MADSPFREKRYRTEEVRAVLRRVLSDETEPGGGRTLTRDELEQMLSDVGASARVAGRALSESEDTNREDGNDEEGFLGGPRRLVFEGEIEGELRDDRREDAVEIIREEMHDQGRVDVLGRTVTWAPTPAANNQQRRLNVKIRVRDGRTRVRVEEDMLPLLAGAWAGFGLGGGLGLGSLGVLAGKATGSFVVGGLVFLLIVALSLFAAWLTSRGVSRRRKRELRKLFDKVRDEVRSGVAPGQRVAEPRGGGVRVPQALSEDADAARAAEREAEAEEEASKAARRA